MGEALGEGRELGEEGFAYTTGTWKSQLYRLSYSGTILTDNGDEDLTGKRHCVCIFAMSIDRVT